MSNPKKGRGMANLASEFAGIHSLNFISTVMAKASPLE